ncbi:MAG: amidohydrolase family protein [Sphingomonadales bacterium]|nr:amidohydrolase family protein [Sphingomonadales bacterium]MBU3993003.1 amidohydrolase family protein [Alphaproteobacteria bacterium]
MQQPAWLRSSLEPALAPDMAIVDPHHHFWDDGPFADMFGRILPEDLVATIDSCGQNVVATVFVECQWSYRADGPEHLRCVGETEQVEAVARKFGAARTAGTALAAGIVGHADLSLGAAVDEVLEAHLAASPTRFRGIRDHVTADPDEPFAGDARKGVMADPQFRAGVARLRQFGLSFDTWCVHTQLADYLALAQAFPDTVFVLNHLATPVRIGRFQSRQAEAFESWKAGISALAGCENVFLKLGGLGMPVAGFHFADLPAPPDSEAIAAIYAPYVRHAVDALSPARCMFESNFSVDGLAYGYGNLWNAYKRIAACYSAEEQRALFHGTAARAYRLNLQAD